MVARWIDGARRHASHLARRIGARLRDFALRFRRRGESLLATSRDEIRSRRAQLFMLSGGAFALAGILVVALIAFLPGDRYPGARATWLDFQHAADRARSFAMFDAKGRYLGVAHPEIEADFLAYPGEELAPLGLYPDHLAVPVADAPRYFWRCLVYLEDRNRGSLRNLNGVDIGSVLAIPFSRRGGSTIEMQLARSFWMLNRENSRVIPRKLREWFVAPTLHYYLSQGGDERRLRAWAAQHIPLVLAAGDEQDIYGVETAAHFMFGLRASELDAGQQLFLAAAVQRPIRWGRTRDSQRQVITRLIGTSNEPGRARLCASADAVIPGHGPVLADARIRQAALGRFERILARIDVAPADPAFARFLAPLLRHNSGPRTGPTRLGLALVPYEQREAIAEMTDAFARADAREAASAFEEGYTPHSWRGRAAEVRLTLDVAKNVRFRRAEREQVLQLSDSLARSLRPASLPYRSHANDGALVIRGGDTPVLIAAADARGQIVRYYNSSGDSIFVGRAAQRINIPGFGRGRYDPQLERRQIGSVGKIAAALLLARAGVTNADGAADNTCMNGVTRNCWTPARGETPLHSPSLRQAFGRSLNAAVARRLAQASDVEASDAFLHSLGLHLPGNNVPSALNIALGRYAGRPLEVQYLAAIALAVARGVPGPVPSPHFIDRYVAFDSAREVFPANPVRRFDYGAFDISAIQRPGSAAFIREVLSEPLCDREHGTLRQLSQWCARTNTAIVIHIAKTGTVSAVGRSGFNESDWWIAGGVQFRDGRSYSYVVSVGSGNSRLAFAHNLGAASAAPLVDVLLRDLLDDA